MGTGDKIRDKAEVLKGKVKEAAGRAVGDPVLEAEGQGDQVKGHLKQAGKQVKDAVKDVFDK
ncbi:MAG: CsbD family protein [Pseudonocardiales bacterium]|nr:CsbD family protein [Pseudonocardiales bacterium]MBV9030314.1 CsbD family protein [Pseudonocardiales bacterium]